MGAQVGDQETHEDRTAPQHQETTSQRAKQMPGAAIREPQVDRSPVFMPSNHSKCCGPPIHFYRLRNTGNRFGPLNCLEKSIV